MNRSCVRIVGPRLTAGLFVVALAGCQELTAPIADPPDFTGVVSQVSLTGDHQGIALDSVNWSWTVDTTGVLHPYAAYVYVNSRGDTNHVLPTAVFVENASGKVSEGSVDQLAVGQRVRVWDSGFVLTSDPPQCGAVQIVIESGQ